MTNKNGIQRGFDVAVVCIRYVFFAAILVACGKDPELQKYIPEKSSLVVCLNGSQLSSKISKDINITEALSLWRPDLITTEQNLLSILENSGINLNSNLYAFILDKDDPEMEGRFFSIIFKLIDESKFDRFIRNLHGESPDIKSFAGMRYSMLDNKTIVGWANKTVFVVGKNTISNEKELKKELRKIRELPEEQSLVAKNEQFKNLLEKKFDAASWVKMEAFKNVFNKVIRRYPLPISLDFKENYTTALINFDKGEILVDADYYNLNESLKGYEDIVKSQINTQLLNQLPVSSSVGVLGLSLNADAMKRTFRNLGGIFFEKQINKLMGVSSNDIFDMLTGDMLTVIKDVNASSNDLTVKKTQLVEDSAQYELLLCLSIKNPATLSKILDKFTLDQSLLRQAGCYLDPKSNTFYIEKDQLLYITTSESVKNEVINGKKEDVKMTNKDLDKLTKESFFVMYADISEKTRKNLPSHLFQGDVFTEGLTKNLQTPFESVFINTQPLKNKISKSKIRIIFKDKEENALKQVLQIFQKKELSKKPTS